jgi:hypothetical protein
VDETTAIIGAMIAGVLAVFAFIFKGRKGKVVEDHSATVEAIEERNTELKTNGAVLKAEAEVLKAEADKVDVDLDRDLEKADADAKKAGHAADDDPAAALADAFNSAD